MVEYAKTGDLKKAAAVVDMTPEGARKALARNREYLKVVLEGKGLTLEAVIEQLAIVGWTSTNDVAKVAALKTLKEHFQVLSTGKQDEFDRMDPAQIVELMRGWIKDYDHKNEQTKVITVEAIDGESGGAEGIAPDGSAGE